MKKSILVLLIISSLSGCANTEWLQFEDRYGYRPGDPCIRCGEKWTVIPNHPFEAQIRRERGEQW